MIRSFADKATERLFWNGRAKQFGSIEKAARRKLEQLSAGATLDDLRTPPGNRLELLKGDRKGQHSIRINDQFRICFRWVEGEGAFDVEIVDYH